ncbi:hypothetical protein [Mastigocoleus sp. MO_188.B34]|uniref:hypothetical protein n=1 Tax=Mastigocoleus sp. MO_188.B34 TaxID=3036635 RepID=UPI00260B6EFB|nr:hypothetical protein [Mastigocoleus sp. MO_188.B34]MDJ0695437.1 hypothetical protein [Mastigocoleus sp. MO_188.B34]
MTTIQKASEKLTIYVNRTGFYALISIIVAPFLLYPLFKSDELKQKELKSNCAHLNLQSLECEFKDNMIQGDKTENKQTKSEALTKIIASNKPETIQLSSFVYPNQHKSQRKELKLDNLKKLQNEVEKAGRYINNLLTYSEETISENTQTDHLSHEVNSGKVRVMIFYGFFLFVICSLLESKPFYEKMIFDRESGDLIVLKFMVFWFKKNKYSLGNNFNLSIESESDDYDTGTHKLNLVLDSKKKILLYRNSNYNEVEKMLEEIRDLLSLDSAKVEKIEV